MPAPATDAFLCTLVSGGDESPLFLVPSVGTTPLSLVRLARALAPRRPVHAFEYAGMEDDGPPHASVAAMASSCVDVMLARSPRGPHLVGGHCFGGLVALEIALGLESRGATVAGLCVLDAVAPPLEHDPMHYADGRADSLAAAGREMRRIFDEMIARTIGNASAMGEERLARVSAVLKVHMEAAMTYRARPLRGRLHVLRTPACPDVVLRNWSKIGAAPVEHHAIPGDTFAMLKPPHVDAVGRTLGRVLAEAA